jgi:hypothetical protein
VHTLPLPIHSVALVYLEETEPSYQTELVDTTQVDRGYQLTSIPFFAKHLALHDIISVETEAGIHYFDDIVAKSGHSLMSTLHHGTDTGPRDGCYAAAGRKCFSLQYF